MNTKFTKALRYIYGNKSRERCYLLLKILFTCVIVFLLVDSNNAIMYIFYYYLRMTKQCINKIISYIYYKEIFPNINSTANICNMYEDEIGEEESLSKDHTDYSKISVCHIKVVW